MNQQQSAPYISTLQKFNSRREVEEMDFDLDDDEEEVANGEE